VRADGHREVVTAKPDRRVPERAAWLQEIFSLLGLCNSIIVFPTCKIVGQLSNYITYLRAQLSRLLAGKARDKSRHA